MGQGKVRHSQCHISITALVQKKVVALCIDKSNSIITFQNNNGKVRSLVMVYGQLLLPIRL